MRLWTTWLQLHTPLRKYSKVKKSWGLSWRGQPLLKESCWVTDSVLSCSRSNDHDCPQYVCLHPLTGDCSLMFTTFKQTFKEQGRSEKSHFRVFWLSSVERFKSLWESERPMLMLCKWKLGKSIETALTPVCGCSAEQTSWHYMITAPWTAEEVLLSGWGGFISSLSSSSLPWASNSTCVACPLLTLR